MIATPTTTVTILRGQTEDDLGDTVDLDTPVATGIPASIIERTQHVYGPNKLDDRIVRTYKLRVAHGTGLLKGDRVVDADGRTFTVINVYQQSNPFWKQDQSADLSYTG